MQTSDRDPILGRGAELKEPIVIERDKSGLTLYLYRSTQCDDR
jgi:hypothetical protein